MKEAVSCGGVVIYRGKVLLLFKSFHNRYDGWVLPKGTVEDNEDFETTAVREVKEETGANGRIVDYIGVSEYEFSTPHEKISKTVHWYLMMGDSYYSKPQKEEHFSDSGFYKYHEAYYLLKYSNERSILEKAFNIYNDLKKKGLWIAER
ncbi:MAG: NUDIX hydrolase [Lachnospiraceae bacterium]|nr:NUDIX hydrolase [Lachnospiraceae bacterium]MBR6349079.1 NUDIX hydrolase [Lachnospiraceae bacterium]